MSLPLKTTAEDVIAIVNYLRTKPTGATIAETKAVLKEVADARKISAFNFWGIIIKEGERIKLSPRGWDFARKSITQEQLLCEVLDRVIPYRSILEWLYHQNMDSISNVDVAAQWHEHHLEAVGSANANSIKDQAVCFLRIAEAAGLGKFSLGRNGASTRLDLNRSALEDYLESGPTSLPLLENMDENSYEEQGDMQKTDEDKDIEVSEIQREQTNSLDSVTPIRVFITHGKNMELVEQVETVLQVAEIDYEVAVKEETVAIPVPDKVFNAMRRCSSAIIIVSAEQMQSELDVTQINPNVLIEIGAAFVLYDRKVVLLWERGVPVPSNLQGLYRCEFEGKELGWGAGMKLMKAIKDFRK